MARKRKDVHEYVELDVSTNGPAIDEVLAKLRSKIIGQDEAVQCVIDALQMFASGLRAPDRTLGNFLFLGPSGTGKTKTVEALAEILLGSPNAFTKINGGEYTRGHEVAKITGAPPGFLRAGEVQPLLSQERIDQHQTDLVKVNIILIDELDKTGEEMWKILMSILDKGHLTMGDNKVTDFTRSFIFMTANWGAKEMGALTKPGFGFGGTDNLEAPDVQRVAMDAARKKMSPEFVGRIDKIVSFKHLGPAELNNILDIELAAVRKRVVLGSRFKPFTFELTDEARQFILNDGNDPRYGARHLKRSIEKHLSQKFAKLLASKQVAAGDFVVVDYIDGELKFRRRVRMDEAA